MDDISELQAAETTAEMFAVRRLLGNRGGSAPRSRPMPAWAWTPTCRPPARCGAIRLWRTSRYAYLLGAPLLDEEALNARLAAYRAVIGSIRQCERASNNHWTLVSLMRNPIGREGRVG
ncbi:MAG: hypothetical protein R3A10_13745 [Caldilineaceae bacterium]